MRPIWLGQSPLSLDFKPLRGNVWQTIDLSYMLDVRILHEIQILYKKGQVSYGHSFDFKTFVRFTETLRLVSCYWQGTV